MRLAVDVGGTFTDVVLETSAGPSTLVGSGAHAGLRTLVGSGADAGLRTLAGSDAQDRSSTGALGGPDALGGPGRGLVSTKVLTTQGAPEVGVLAAVEAVLAEAGVVAADLNAVVHGTTLATNALIERRGAFCAFVTTAGFRDVVETRTESRFDQYDLNLVLPRPLVERRHRYVLRERMSAHGEVLVPFDEAGARRLAETLAHTGYESVAVGFLHSYRNPDHERRFRDLLRDVTGDVAISISSEVSPQMRELERFNTVCANAYVQPAIARYLHRLRDQLRALGAGCPVYMIHSGGGLMSLDSAAELPVRLVESGPAGGAIFAADIAARHNLDRVISYDMGGTTAKICLIEDSTPRTAKTFEVARTTRFAKGSGMSISIPVIEMIEIGAGGGSVVSVDMLDQIRVGPRSAGADPGPACYGLGGREPTVTDADVVLGRLAPETFGAPGIQLDGSAARRSLVGTVGERLGLDADSAAVGVSEVVDENMANAARVHAVESGKVLDGFTMVAFGGAAPAHAARLASKLGITDLLVPPGAGVGSAIGFLRAPFAYEAVRSHYVRLDDFDPTEVQSMLSELTTEAVSFVSEAVAVSAVGPGSAVGSGSAVVVGSAVDTSTNVGLGSVADAGSAVGTRSAVAAFVDDVGSVATSGAASAAGIGGGSVGPGSAVAAFVDDVGSVATSGAASAAGIGGGSVGPGSAVGTGSTIGAAPDADSGGGAVGGGTDDMADMTIERWVHMRYSGQGWEIPVQLQTGHIDACSGELLAIEFTKAYEEFFGRAIAGLSIEAVGWSVRASVPQPRGFDVARAEAGSQATAVGVRTVMDTSVMAETETVVVERSSLSKGVRVLGPAVIVEPQTTTVVPSTHEAVAQPDGCLLLRPQSAKNNPPRTGIAGE